MTTAAIIQARMGSTRLPGKTLMILAGQPVLARVVERVSRAKKVDRVLVATTSSLEDLAIVRLCKERGWGCHRGSENDVLDRYYHASRELRATEIVRITADCPLVDPDLIDQAVGAFRTHRCDYASNGLEPRTYPRGLDVEVFSSSALTRAWREDTNPAWREHVTPYIYHHPEKFRLLPIAGQADHSQYRWTLDTSEDYELLRRIFDHFDNRLFGWTDVLHLVEEHPDWNRLNRNVRQKVVP